MDNLSPTDPGAKSFDICGFSTPGTTPTGTPTGTPKMTRAWSRTKLGRRGSEPDLEGACELSQIELRSDSHNLARTTFPSSLASSFSTKPFSTCSN